jgi:hypothetical protein
VIRARVLFASCLAVVGCSFILDFDDIEKLPCECLPDYICLDGSDRCVRRGSVEDFKSCTTAARDPDALCVEGSRCFNNEGRGHRCLPRCTPSNYATAESGANINKQCPEATTCWTAEAGTGVCDRGECEINPNSCPPTKECVTFNNAGVCFATCNIFSRDACVGDEACHPIGESPVTACIKVGQRDLHELCSDTDPCKQEDATGRALVCDRPVNSSDRRRCWPICSLDNTYVCAVPGESCLSSRPNVIDSGRRLDLGLCVVQI